MVLTRRPPRCTAALPLIAAALSACVSVRSTVVKAPRPTSVCVVALLDREDSRGVEPVPARVAERVGAALTERNLQPSALAAGLWEGEFASRRTTAHRVAWMASHTDAELLLLLETKAVFYSALNGRYRWTVDGKATLVRRASPADATTGSFELPAFLDFEHEREARALEAGAAPIAEKIGSLADSVLGTLAEKPAQESARPSGDSIYFVLVDRFANGDPSNDADADPSDPEAFHGGDLQGVLDRLEDLQRLGVKTVWLSPGFRMRPQKFFGHGAYHGYWTEDLARVEPRFGDEALLRKVSDELHRRGMRLVLDLVLNHVAPDAPLARERPDWFHHNGPIRDWNDRAQLENNDVKGLPDLAQEREEVYRHLLVASLHWIDRVRPDGFRLDAVKHVPLAFWARFNADLRAHAGPAFMLLGEDLDGNPAHVARTLREGGFTAVFDFPLYYAATDVFCRGANPARLAAMLVAEEDLPPESLVTLLDNHDLPRIASLCAAGRRTHAALAFLLTARGIPSILYGTETGQVGEKEPDIRRDAFLARVPETSEVARHLRLRRPAALCESGLTRILHVGTRGLVLLRVDERSAAIVRIDDDAPNSALALPSDLADAVPGVRLAQDWSALECSTRAGCDSRVDVAPLAPPAGRDFRAVLASLKNPAHKALAVAVTGAPSSEGDAMVLAGAGRLLGEWDPARGLGPLVASEGAFTGTVSLPEDGVYEFKLVMRRADGTVRWEDRDNRYLVVSAAGPRLALRWNGPDGA